MGKNYSHVSVTFQKMLVQSKWVKTAANSGGFMEDRPYSQMRVARGFDLTHSFDFL